jgi:nitroimidazol reductase NimA-like FMN-containing flavoprotein (pyridoxamine 5'-phosphate oxidase superfamily)
MTAEQRDLFLAQPLIARLATSERDRPRVLPMWYWWDGAYVWMETGAAFPNARILRDNPHAAVAIDVSGGGLHLLAVVMRGEVDLVSDPPELVAATLHGIYERYVGAEGLERPDVQTMLGGEHVLLRFRPSLEVSWASKGDVR